MVAANDRTQDNLTELAFLQIFQLKYSIVRQTKTNFKIVLKRLKLNYIST